jgi:CHASE1-domain containing sensor protein
VTDIEAEKKRKVDELKATLSIVDGNLHGVRGDLEKEYSRAANFERQGKRLPEDVKKRISEIEKSVRSTEELYKQREKEIENTTNDYDKAIQRFKEIQIRRGRVSPTP